MNQPKYTIHPLKNRRISAVHTVRRIFYDMMPSALVTQQPTQINSLRSMRVDDGYSEDDEWNASFTTLNDTNVAITVSSAGNVHTITMAWLGVLAHGRGGTDVSSPGASGNVLTSNGTDWVSSAPAAGGTHNILSATHPDTLAAGVARGDLIVGNATPKWSRFAVGIGLLHANGTDVTGWSLVALASDVSGTLPLANGGTNRGSWGSTDYGVVFSRAAGGPDFNHDVNNFRYIFNGTYRGLGVRDNTTGSTFASSVPQDAFEVRGGARFSNYADFIAVSGAPANLGVAPATDSIRYYGERSVMRPFAVSVPNPDPAALATAKVHDLSCLHKQVWELCTFNTLITAGGGSSGTTGGLSTMVSTAARVRHILGNAGLGAVGGGWSCVTLDNFGATAYNGNYAVGAHYLQATGTYSQTNALNCDITDLMLYAPFRKHSSPLGQQLSGHIVVRVRLRANPLGPFHGQLRITCNDVNSADAIGNIAAASFTVTGTWAEYTLTIPAATCYNWSDDLRWTIVMQGSNTPGLLGGASLSTTFFWTIERVTVEQWAY